MIFLLPLSISEIFPSVYCVSVPQPVLIFSLFRILTLKKFAAMDSGICILDWLGHSKSYSSCLSIAVLRLDLKVDFSKS